MTDASTKTVTFSDSESRPCNARTDTKNTLVDQLVGLVHKDVQRMRETKQKKVWLTFASDLPDSLLFQQQVEKRVDCLGVNIEWISTRKINIVLIA